ACGGRHRLPRVGLTQILLEDCTFRANAELARLFPCGNEVYPAGTVAASKNRGWLIAAFTVDRWSGLVIRKVGSGRVPVSRRSGNAVMKITGTENSARMSFTASMPELSSASWMSASTSVGGDWRAWETASVRVTATPVTL